jgi:hypothetical protein
MPSLIFNSAVEDIARGAIDLDTDTFRVMLVTAAYTPNKATHSKRSNVTNEVTGTGYTAGGVISAVTVTRDDANNRVDATFANVSWANSTITARAAVIYKARGGANTADELVAYVDFNSDIISSNGTFQVSFSSPLRFQN